MECFEHSGEKKSCACIVVKLQSVRFGGVNISGGMHKNIQDTTAALENCGKPWAIWSVAGLS
jgi:hypothetical protein